MLVNDDYEQWMRSLAAHPEVGSRTLGRSIQGRPIQALITEQKPEVVYLFGRQHPPEITGGLAMQSFVDALGTIYTARNSEHQALNRRDR